MATSFPEFVQDVLQLAGTPQVRLRQLFTIAHPDPSLRSDYPPKIWEVNGKLVRNRIDIEFTNGGHHWSNPYIPADEVWIDQSQSGFGEQDFWAARQLLERQLRSGGSTENEAFKKAQDMEIDLRRTSQLGTDQLPGTLRRYQLPDYWGYKVFIVNGKLVRDMIDIEFSLGGNGLRYEYIPKEELWLDDVLVREERPAILRHEAVEADLMRQGMSYEQAHEHANVAEKKVRDLG